MRVITFHFSLYNSKGELLDSSDPAAPPAYLEGADAVPMPLEMELGRMKAGERRRVTVSSRWAYGARDEDLVLEIPKTSLPEGVTEGGFFETLGDHPVRLHVRFIGEKTVTLDGNHPLAGEDLIYEIELISMRQATPEEQEHGHLFSESLAHVAKNTSKKSRASFLWPR